jgi:Zn-dependent protease with chaperone function
VLINEGGSLTTNSAQIEEARWLVARAQAQLPDQPSLLQSAFWTSYAADDLVAMKKASVALQRVDESSPETWYVTAIVAIQRGDAARARAAIAKARKTGLSAEGLASLETTLASFEKEHFWTSLTNVGLWSVPVWLVLLGLLAVAGLVLSRATLAAADRALTGATGDAVGMDAWLRRAYSGVIAASAVIFYLSLPMLLIVVLALGVGVIWLMLTAHFVIWKLVILIAILTLVTVWAVLRSMFVRGDKSDPGDPLDLAAHPRLRSVLEEVAGRVGTRSVDTVFLTPGTDVAVFERGGWLRKLQGRGERCLILGLGVLEGMKVGGWKAILAHEYGHFVNRDTAGGGMALAVRRSILTMAISMARGGAAGWYNPAWWFVRGFDAAFMRVSQGASRLQEVLADRWAALSYGAPAFRDGLTHVITASVRFEAVTDATIKRALHEKIPVANLYRHTAPLTVAGTLEVERLTQQALTREPGAYDSHPSPAQRFAWVEKVASSAPPSHADPADEDEAWSLFQDREELEVYMTATVRTNVEQNYGVKFTDATDTAGTTGAAGVTVDPSTGPPA